MNKIEPYFTHIHDTWTGRCSCGAGPFTGPEHDAHVMAVDWAHVPRQSS